MSGNGSVIARETPETGGFSGVPNGIFDLVVLRSMAQKLLVTLRALELPVNKPLPLRYSFEERHGRAHRMIIFTPHDLLALNQLAFVGFVSSRRKMLDQQIIDEMFRVDQQMLGELVHVPDLLSYSSLELRKGNWYNLVVLREIAARSHFRTLETHRYAADQLSPAYYEWIRLHHGSLPGGLTLQKMVLHSTKFYCFPAMQQSPAVRELIYKK